MNSVVCVIKENGNDNLDNVEAQQRLSTEAGSCWSTEAMCQAAWVKAIVTSLFLILPLEVTNYLLQDKAPWSDCLEQNGGPFEAPWCEAQEPDLTAFMIEPSNSRSNYLYIVSSIFVLFLGISDSRIQPKTKSSKAKACLTQTNLLMSHPILSISFGVAILILGVGSFFFHASECRTANTWDVAGMYAVLVWPGVYSVVGLIPTLQTPRRVLIVPIVQLCIVVAKLIQGLVFPTLVAGLFSPTWVFGGFSTGIGLLALLKRRRSHRHQVWLLLMALAFFSMGYMLWTLDVRKNLCKYEKIVPGHALWHVFTSVSILCIYLFIRGERSRGAFARQHSTVVDTADSFDGDEEPPQCNQKSTAFLEFVDSVEIYMISGDEMSD